MNRLISRLRCLFQGHDQATEYSYSSMRGCFVLNQVCPRCGKRWRFTK